MLMFLLLTIRALLIHWLTKQLAMEKLLVLHS